MNIRGFLTAMLACTPLSAIHAQGPGSCELHFWASDIALTSNYSGVDGLAGKLLEGPSPQTREGLVSDLPRAAQGEALKAVDLATALNMPGVQLIQEPGLPDYRAVKRAGPRLTASTAPCYAELVVDYIGYTSHITAGRKFGARFWLRRFPDGATTALVQNGGKDVKLKIYPARKPEDQPGALAEIRTAFGKVAEGFLQNKVR